MKRFDPAREEAIAAAWLHDVLEDTACGYSDVVHAVGSERVADIVYAVTDELGKNRKERYARTIVKIVEDDDAMLVKLADKISNTRAAREDGNPILRMYQEDFPKFAEHRGDFPQFNELWDELRELVEKT